MEKLDKIDKQILSLVQENATTTVADIARKVGLSTSPCWRRIQRMEEEGIIKQRVALLDAGLLNVGLTVFVSIRTNSHNEDWLSRFSRIATSFPEVVELYRMSGDIDYLMRVVVPDMRAYDIFYQKLIKSIEITDVSSSFAMEQIKFTTQLPLNHLLND